MLNPLEDPRAALPIDAHGVTIVGSAHGVNQDGYAISTLGTVGSAPAFLFAVADGIGGGPAGERASSRAIRSIEDQVRKAVSEPDAAFRTDWGKLLRRDFMHCHEELLADIEAHPELFGMGTTLTVAVVIWPTVWVVHAGDSRCYRLRDGVLERLTLDHTVVQKLADEGVLTPEAARVSRWRHAIWNHLGKRSGELDPEVVRSELRHGDSLLLTTDGITDPLPDPEINALAGEAKSARSVTRRIVWAAGEKSGRDDMTLIAVRFSPPG